MRNVGAVNPSIGGRFGAKWLGNARQCLSFNFDENKKARVSGLFL
jgi:hypothetical protein